METMLQAPELLDAKNIPTNMRRRFANTLFKHFRVTFGTFSGDLWKTCGRRFLTCVKHFWDPFWTLVGYLLDTCWTLVGYLLDMLCIFVP
jgi:hypothetical protein